MNMTANTDSASPGRAPLNSRHDTFFFDFSAVLNHRESLQRHPERVSLMCQAQVRTMAPAELMVPDDKGFYLVVRTRRGAAADALADEIKQALHQRLFGTGFNSEVVSTFRTLTPDNIVELDVGPGRGRSPVPRKAVHGAPVHPGTQPAPVLTFGLSEFRPGVVTLFGLQQPTSPIHLCGAISLRDGQTLFGSDALRFCHQQYRPAVDLAMLRYALRLPVGTSASGAIAASVGYETLACPASRQLYCEALQGAGPSRTGSLIVKVDDVPFGTPASRLTDIITGLKPFVRQVFAQLVECDETLMHSDRIGLAGVCASIAPRSGSQLPRIAGWLHQTAQAQQSQSCFLGAPGPAAFRQLRNAGIAYAAQRPESADITSAPLQFEIVHGAISRAA